jgi:hypothetical protein
MAPTDDVPVGGGSSKPTKLSLDRAESFEALAVARMLLDEPVLVDALALAPLRCMTVTVKASEPLPQRDAANKLFDALRAQGMRVDRAKGVWTVAIDEARPPKPCSVGRATAADEGAARTPPMEADPAAVTEEILRSIREISPTEHVISQRGLELLFENQSVLTKLARIVPEQENGKVVGLRLFGVRADGVLGRLGFENGDRLERVMQKPMTNPEQALEIYSIVRNAKTIPIEVNRRGVATKLVVRVE